MSNNLGRTLVAANQNDKEDTINDADGALDAALTEQLTVSVASGNGTVTAAQLKGNVYFKVTGAATTGRTVTFSTPSKRLAFVENASSTNSVDLIVGSTTLTLGASAGCFVYLDGTTNGLVKFETASTSKPGDVGFYLPGVSATSTRVAQIVLTRNFVIPSGMTNSKGYAVTAPSGGSIDFDVQKNGASVGTVSFASGSNTATFTMASQTSFAAGDRLGLVSPSNLRTAADISITCAGSVS